MLTQVRSAFPAIRAYVSQAMNSIRDIITGVTAIAKAVWGQFGSAITSIARRDLGAVVSVVRNELQAVLSAFKLIGDLLHGRWGKVWEDLKSIASHELHATVAVIRGLVGTFATAAAAIGKAIVSGILSGISGLPSSLGSKLKSYVEGAIHWAGGLLHGSGEWMATKHLIGEPLAQGVIEGWIIGSAQLPSKISDTLRNAVETARQAIESRRGSFQTAWGQLQSDALSAFDGIANGIKTKSEKLLANLQLQKQIADIADQINQARSGLVTAQASGDPTQIQAAQKQLDDALYQQQVFQLQRQAETERLNLDARTALRRRHFEDALTTLGLSLDREGATHKQAQQKIIKLLGGFGIDYKKSGLALGSAFAQGLRESMKDVISAAEKLADEVRKRLKLHSPAETGPLSDLNTWWRALGPTLVASAGGGLAGALNTAAGSVLSPATAGGSSFAGASGSSFAGRPVTFEVHNHIAGSVISEDELLLTVRRGLQRTASGLPSDYNLFRTG